MSRVLLADDSQQALRLGEQILAAQGIEVVSVTDGASALRRLTDVDPDVLITDVFLPTKNGFDLARYIKAQPELRRIRIIFAAGIADQFNEQDAKNAGADVVLRKPFEASALLAAIEPLLNQSQSERAKTQDETGVNLDRASIRAAVTLALDAAMPTLIDELTESVMLVLNQQRVLLQPAPFSATAAPDEVGRGA